MGTRALERSRISQNSTGRLITNEGFVKGGLDFKWFHI